MHTVRNMTLEDFYLLEHQHCAATVDPLEGEETEDEDYDDEMEEDEEDVVMIEGTDDEAEDDEEDEPGNVDEADSESVRRLMVSSRPRRRRSPAAGPRRSAGPAPRQSGRHGG